MYEQRDATNETMSTAETLSAIFFEPTQTFDSLRERPRLFAATLIVIAAATLYNALLIQRIGYENLVRRSVEEAPRLSAMRQEEKEQIIQQQLEKSVFKYLNYASPAIVVVVLLIVGAALYLAGALAMGGKMNYRQAFSVYVYSSLPPVVLKTIADAVTLFLQAPEEIDLAQARRGLARTNLGFLVDATAHPVLATLLGVIDLFGFYGLYLAAIGMGRVGRLSPAARWGVVLTIWLLGVALRVLFALLAGTPMA